MELFDPERPEITQNRKALLIDGSAIPAFVLTSQPDNQILVSVMLHKYDAHGGYAWHETELPISELSLLFTLFQQDPEQTLDDYFGWRPQAHSRPSVRAIPIQRGIAPQASPLEDLL